MERETLTALIENGYADEAGLAAEVACSDGVKYLCVNGEVVTLAAGNPPAKVFSDSIDKLENLTVKSGLFKKRVCFTHNGENYDLAVKSGKNVVEYFKLIG